MHPKDNITVFTGASRESRDEQQNRINDELQELISKWDSEGVLALLARSRELYQSITGQTASPSTVLGELIAEEYRGMLKEVTPDKLNSWAAERPWLKESLLKKRASSVFYRDSIVILLGLLITENETAVPSRWPVDSDYLEDYYSTLGISTNGLF